jgi:hypothetical protein
MPVNGDERAELCAQVEGLPVVVYAGVDALIRRADVLALIDKAGE